MDSNNQQIDPSLYIKDRANTATQFYLDAIGNAVDELHMAEDHQEKNQASDKLNDLTDRFTAEMFAFWQAGYRWELPK